MPQREQGAETDEPSAPSDTGARHTHLTGVFGAVLLAAIGLLFLGGSLNLEFGSVGMMGPGFFPMVLSIIALGLATALMLQSLGRADAMYPVEVRPLLSVAGAILAFALLIEHVGFIPTIFATVLLAASADTEARLGSTVALGATVSVGAWALFSLGLGLSMPAFRMAF